MEELGDPDSLGKMEVNKTAVVVVCFFSLIMKFVTMELC